MLRQARSILPQRRLNSFIGQVLKMSSTDVSKKGPVLVDYESTGSKGDRIAIITFNRPKRKNAFTEKSYGEVAARIREADGDASVKAIVMTGAGDYYSSGNDLSNFSKLMHPVTMAKQGREILYDFVDSFIGCKTPLVAAVNGPAFGIAVTTLGLCDVVVASKTTKLKTPFAELGQAPEGCSSYTFPQIMGNELANKLLWDGEIMTAEAALKSGLVHQVVEDSAVMNTAMGEAQKLAAAKTPLKLHEKLAKRLSVSKDKASALVTTLQEVNAEECDVLEKAWVSDQCLTALGGFLKSRNNNLLAFLMYILNMLGFLWGQPSVVVPRPGFRN